MRKFALMLVLLLFAGVQVVLAQTTITGVVTSADDGNPVPGASVQVKGTTTGVTTDINGRYSLRVPANAQVLMFKFVGMTTKEVTIGTQTTINVVLETEAMDIEGVIVTAMGISREKKALGYAAQEVANEDLTRSGSNNLATALQGKVSGIEIKPSSGMPGASSQIVIRGARSFSGDNTPLYVVDGMPIASTPDFSTGNSVTGADIANRAIDLDPNDIESINVLKGQAAAALYGIRASNGVIIITTKSGKGKAIGKPNVSISNFTSWDQVSTKPEYQSTYAQGSYGNFIPNTSYSWGPKLSDLPDHPTYGGNANGHPGMYKVPQLEQAGLDPWVTPATYDNFGDFFETGMTTTTSVNVSQATERGNIAFGIGNTNQKGIVPSTDMNRWNAKAAGESRLNDLWTLGFSSNYSNTDINKLPSANDASLNGAYAAPPSYNLKGIPYAYPTDPYKQIYFRSLTFDNPYWGAENNKFTEGTERFFGNGYVQFAPKINETMSITTRYQLGIDTYTSHYQDIFEYGHRGAKGEIYNYGISSSTLNSLLTINYNWKINEDLKFGFLLGNEVNHRTRKLYDDYGSTFNFGGWAHIGNANIVTAFEEQYADRNAGFFANLSLDYKGLLYFNATNRLDYVSTMPRDNNSFMYPSVSLGFVLSELDAMKGQDWLSFAKLRASWAKVGLAASEFLPNYFAKPDYSGGFWGGYPINYPINGLSGYVANNIQYDPGLMPQTTNGFELGAELRVLNNRLGIDYSYSYQDIYDQIFQVPLAASTGAASLVTNGGSINTVAHEIILYTTPVSTSKFTWDLNFNFTTLENKVLSLADGVESIFLGGFVTPQVRAGIGNTFPVIYGTSFVRDGNGNIVVNDDPESWDYGMPLIGEPKVIGEASPDFILGATTKFTYMGFTLASTWDWKSGGQMYHGTNGLLDLYGVSKNTEDRESTFIYEGVKPDGTPNDIQRGGPDDPDAYQDLVTGVLTSIDEYYIMDNSFIKMRDLTLGYRLPKKVFNNKVDLDLSVYVRNLLIWSELPNFDPEASQGNNNMGGAFERFSMPQTTSYGFGINLNF